MADEALLQAGAAAPAFATGSFGRPGASPESGTHLTAQDAALLEEIHREHIPSRDFAITPAGRVDGSVPPSSSRLILVLGAVAATLLVAIGVSALHVPLVPALGVLAVVGGGVFALKFVHRSRSAETSSEVGSDASPVDAPSVETSSLPVEPEVEPVEGSLAPPSGHAPDEAAHKLAVSSNTDVPLPGFESVSPSNVSTFNASPSDASTPDASTPDASTASSTASSTEDVPVPLPVTALSKSEPANGAAPSPADDAAQGVLFSTENATMTCPQGHTVKATHRFCGTCGAPNVAEISA